MWARIFSFILLWERRVINVRRRRAEMYSVLLDWNGSYQYMNTWFLTPLSWFLHMDRYRFLFLSDFLVLTSEISVYISFLSSVSCHSSWCMRAKSLQSCPTLSALWTGALQAPVSMGFSRHEYWSGLACPPPWDLPDPGIKPTSFASPVLAGRFFILSTTW